MVLAGVLLFEGGARRIAVADVRAAIVCRVSNTAMHPLPGRPSFNFGSARLAVVLPEGARFAAIPAGSPRGANAFIQKNGWIRTKTGWFAARGTPKITGRRVDGRGRRLRAHVGPLSSSGGGPFYPSNLYFPSFGCWRITATAGGARLTATVRVFRLMHRR